MSHERRILAAAALMVCLASSGFAGPKSKDAVENQPAPAVSAEAKEAEYARKLEDRVGKIVQTLALRDEAAKAHVHALIVAQYRTLNVWHETNDAHLKELKKLAAEAGEEAVKAKADLGSIKETLKGIHDRFLVELGKSLSAEQVERVKDGMTVGKVQFTYTGYLQAIPSLTEEQKAKVLELLKEAREEAMDAGSMDEKSDIFNRYKGRINNWLSKQGVDQGKGKKPKVENQTPPAKSS